MLSRKLTLILQNLGMSARASYYSGRGVTSSDLNRKHLFAIHEKIQEEFGEEQARSFVSMIKDSKDLSASSFLQSLEHLEQNSFQWESVFAEESKKLPIDTENPTGTLIGVFLSMNSSKSEEDVLEETNSLKFHFLKCKLPEDEYAEWENKHSKIDVYGDKHFRTFY